METAYTAARERAAFLDRSARGRMVISGADRASYLQGLLTNDIASLKAGTGCYAAYLTAQGRLIADMWIYELGDVMLMALHGDVKDDVIARFDRFIFTEDVQLGDVTATFAEIAVVGPQAAAILAQATDVSVDALAALPEHGNVRASFSGTPAIVTRITDVGEPGYEVYVQAEQRTALADALRASGVLELGADAAETIRIEAGVPLFHRDMDEETIPLEAGLDARAISFTKGCYVGQEVIVRVLHRGHGRVAKRLVALQVDGDRVPGSGAIIRADGDKDVGHVTSAAWSPRLGRPVALGYVQRDYAEPETSVRISASSAGGNVNEASSARVTQRIS